jgi:hypothetical protein
LTWEVIKITIDRGSRKTQLDLGLVVKLNLTWEVIKITIDLGLVVKLNLTWEVVKLTTDLGGRKKPRRTAGDDRRVRDGIASKGLGNRWIGGVLGPRSGAVATLYSVVLVETSNTTRTEADSRKFNMTGTLCLLGRMEFLSGSHAGRGQLWLRGEKPIPWDKMEDCGGGEEVL